MADPFSITAGTVSLIDVVIRSLAKTSKVISGIINASAEIRRTEGMIHELRTVLENLKDLAPLLNSVSGNQHDDSTVASICNTLESIHEELRCLEKALSLPNKEASTSVNRFGKKIKSAFNEDRIARISRQIESHKSTLSILLGLAGR